MYIYIYNKGCSEDFIGMKNVLFSVATHKPQSTDKHKET